jgi:membrane protein implicated in regulation of membrane protease activity
MTSLAVHLAWGWAVAAVLVALLELFVPGFYLIWFACAAGITAVLTFAFDWSLSAQLTAFIIASLGSCVVGYYVYRGLTTPLRDSETINRRDLDLVGTTGIAAEVFVNGRGRVRIADTVWLAESSDEIAAGAGVRIVAVNGTTLVVARQ